MISVSVDSHLAMLTESDRPVPRDSFHSLVCPLEKLSPVSPGNMKMTAAIGNCEKPVSSQKTGERDCFIYIVISNQNE